MKKRLLYIIVLILTGITNSTFIYGQSGSMLEKLQGKTWRWQSKGGSYSDDRYTRNEQIITDNGISSDRPFYLSDTPDTWFDESKVGKVENGKYMILEGSDPDDEFFRVFVYEIIKLDDTEFTVKLSNGSISTQRVLDACTIKYAMDRTPIEKMPFSGKGKGTLDGYNFPINNKTIQDRLYENVQLSQYKTVTEVRGKFLRKCLLTNGNYIVIVSFGDTYDNRTDILCLVDRNGSILSTLEGLVIVKGVKVKEYTITGEDGIVYVSQVVPSTSTPSLSFEGFPNFSGNVVVTSYYIVGGKFVKSSTNTNPEKTFTKSRMSDPDLNVPQY